MNDPKVLKKLTSACDTLCGPNSCKIKAVAQKCQEVCCNFGIPSKVPDIGKCMKAAKLQCSGS